MEQEKTIREVYHELDAWKRLFYNFHDLIKNDALYSKLPQELIFRIKDTNALLNHLKSYFIIPLLLLWSVFLIRFEYFYYKIRYPRISTLQNLKNEKFDYLFVLNTRDHIITALPVLESMDSKTRNLVVTFKGVYNRYKEDFDNLKNIKIICFDYELKNIPVTKYLRIMNEAKKKFRFLESYSINNDLKRLIAIDKNFIKFHLKTELIQFYFFEKVFNAFDLQGVVSIVFTTAFELCEKRGVPTFILQHGIGGKGHGHPYVCDYWFTPDDVSKESLDGWLDHTVNVLALGSPRFEYLKNHIDLQRGKNTKIHKKIDKLNVKKIVTYISQGGTLDNQTTFLALKMLRDALPKDVLLIIKLHPRENLNESNVKKQMKKHLTRDALQKMLFIRNEVDFYDIMVHSDIVIAATSTGIQEAIACDIPVIQVNFTGKPYPAQYDLHSFGWRKPISDPEVMVAVVGSLLSDNGRYMDVIEKQKSLKDVMITNLGNCGDVIAEMIISICNRETIDDNI